MNKTTASRLFLLTSLVSLMAMAACASSSSPTASLGLEVPPDFQIELFTADLNGPTQMISGPDGRLWLAQLNGPENESNGQVLALDQDDPERREVLLTGLFKPTGIAVAAEALWIAAGRDLLRAEIDQEGNLTEPSTILKDLPFNGRSNGTLTITPEGDLLYETSGRRSGNEAVEGSASLWLLDPADPTNPKLLASGLKNAYAHTFDNDGQLWVTEIGDDPVNGEPPPDELNLIVAGGNYGWPQCYGQQEPALNYGGNASICQETEPAAATFPARSTPTSVVLSPWDDHELLITLWGPTNPALVQATFEKQAGGVVVRQVSPFVTGLQHPQSLLVMDNSSLLISDFEDGRIYRIWR